MQYYNLPHQYHDGFDKLWAALGLTDIPDKDVFTLAAERIRSLEADGWMNEHEAAKYHNGLDKLWYALGLTGPQNEDVFTLAAERIRSLEAGVRATMNQYRVVETFEDGDLLQCLNCKGTWEGYAAWRFCPRCGTPIMKRACREHTTPRWRYEYALKHSMAAAWKLQFPQRPIFRWMIQDRHLEGGQYLDWQKFLLLRFATTRQALEALKQVRQEASYQEYRLVRSQCTR